MRAAALALLLVGCGGASASENGGPPVDSTLVSLLADLQLADARAALAPDSMRGDMADSLRRLALVVHDTEADRLEDRLDALGRDPALTRATYEAVEDRLDDERQGPLTP